MTVRRPFVIGLTGSVGMGKSTTAAMFRERGIPVWDADAAVDRLYAPHGKALPGIAALDPALVGDGGVDREALRAWVFEDPDRLPVLERIVHPLVAADRAGFIRTAESDIVVLDVPLLFETGAEDDADMIVVVSTDPQTQKRRVLARPGMTRERFRRILSRQLPDADKRARADRVIETRSLDMAQAAVEEIIREIRERQPHA